MSLNLVDAVKGLIPIDLVNKASSFLGESETGVGKALSGILPTLLGGLMDKTSSAEGADMVAMLSAEQHQSGIADNLAGFFGSDSGSLVNKGAGLLTGIFGDKVGGLTSILSGFSGIKSSSASSLLSMVAPMVLSFLGKHAITNNLNASGLASLLNSQKDNIVKAIPTGLNLGSIFGNTGSITSSAGSAVKSSIPSALPVEKEISEKQGGSLQWLLPLLLLILLAAGAWYFMGKSHQKPAEESPGTVAAATSMEETPKAITTATGMVDTTGNFVYDLGKMVTIELPNGAGTLTVGENSTENKLYKFLSDSNAAIDTVKGNWFEFTNVRFKTGGSQIDSASAGQLINIVSISKGFPAASFKLGGYTDNTGDSLSNVMLSQKRAEAVAAALKKLGCSVKSITGAKGYGPQFPIGDNATGEGRAMNRRVALNVKSK